MVENNTKKKGGSEKMKERTIEMKKVHSPQVFHNIGWNLLGSFTYNYGLNFIGAVGATFVMIITSLDWKWRNFVFDNEWLAIPGALAIVISLIVPAITPLAFYLSGKIFKDQKLKIAAAVLTQTFILTMIVQSTLKIITGRMEPGLINDGFHIRNFSENNFCNVFNWFNMEFIKGWPSGHTATAFSAAATISKIYHDNFWVKMAVYTYATFIGFGVTLYAHWTSELIAGALIGYAIGKTVAKK
jgi:membrane-associated phospholipid phosphatase